MKNAIGDIIAAAGIIAAGTGLWIIYPPVALIGIGVIMVLLGIEIDKKPGA
jgi:hypothetical protein